MHDIYVITSMRCTRHSAVHPFDVFFRCRAQIKLVIVAAAYVTCAKHRLLLGLALHPIQAVYTAVEYQALRTRERDGLCALRIFEIEQDLQQIVLPQVAMHHLCPLARCARRNGDGEAGRQ